MPDVIRTFPELLDALAALPPPPPGKVRVYRGQTARHSALLPTGLRGDRRPEVLWGICAVELARARNAPRAEGGADLVDWLVWARAIKQHYGPGTEYLDVTRSPGIAAWFALHDASMHVAEVGYGPPGPSDPALDVYGEHTLVRYTPRTDTPGWLYVMDAEPGDGPIDRRHGAVHDLALAPPAFRSLRIGVQQACLLRADPAVAGGDLSSFVVAGTPLAVAWPLEGCPEVGWDTSRVFPPPADDDWYADFVSMPLAVQVDRSASRAVFDHPIPVSLYLPDTGDVGRNDRLLEDLFGRLTVPRPPLLFAALLSSADADPTLSAATAVLLEGPMTEIMPVHRMNVRLLSTALQDSVPCRRLGSDRRGSVDFTNVFLESSPLDRLSDGPAAAGSQVRAVWVRRQESQFRVVLYGSTGTEEPRALVDVVLAHDREGNWSKRVERWGHGRWKPFGDDEPEAAPFFRALCLLRSLGAHWKLAALPVGVRDETTSLVPVEWLSGEVVALSDFGSPLGCYHVLRQCSSEEPYFGGSRSAWAQGPLLCIEKFPQRTLVDLLAALAPLDLDHRPPPFA